MLLYCVRVYPLCQCLQRHMMSASRALQAFAKWTYPCFSLPKHSLLYVPKDLTTYTMIYQTELSKKLVYGFENTYSSMTWIVRKQIMAELETLLQQEIPNGRKALLDGKGNLENVANYCQQLYVDVSIIFIFPFLTLVWYRYKLYRLFSVRLHHLFISIAGNKEVLGVPSWMSHL